MAKEIVLFLQCLNNCIHMFNNGSSGTECVHREINELGISGHDKGFKGPFYLEETRLI